jgi:hypothetical protein
MGGAFRFAGKPNDDSCRRVEKGSTEFGMEGMIVSEPNGSTNQKANFPFGAAKRP